MSRKKSIIWACLFLGCVIVILLVISYLRSKAYDQAAYATGLHAKLVMEAYYMTSGREGSGCYTSKIVDLLKIDKSLVDMPEISFSFTNVNCSGYTISTKHPSGRKSFSFTPGRIRRSKENGVIQVWDEECGGKLTIKSVDNYIITQSVPMNNWEKCYRSNLN